MLKSKEFWIGFLVAVVVFVALGEIQRSNARSEALTTLNSQWPTLKTDESKLAAIVAANAVIIENKSIFDFSNSSADEDGDEPLPMEDGNQPLLGPRARQAIVETFEVYHLEYLENKGTSSWEVKCFPGITQC